MPRTDAVDRYLRVTSPPGWPKHRPCLACGKGRKARNAGDRICGVCKRKGLVHDGGLVVAGIDAPSHSADTD